MLNIHLRCPIVDDQLGMYRSKAVSTGKSLAGHVDDALKEHTVEEEHLCERQSQWKKRTVNAHSHKHLVLCCCVVDDIANLRL